MKRFGRFTTSRYVILALMVALIVAMLAPLTVRHAVAQTESTAIVSTGKMNFRSGPGAGYPVVASAEQFTKVKLLGRNAAASWAKVRLPNNVEGWGSTFYMEPNVPWSSLPVITEQGNPSEPTGFVTAGALNVRSGPTNQHAILFVVSKGTALGLVGRNSNGTWLNVRVSGKLGWANASFILTDVSIMSLPDTSGTAPGLPTATPTRTPTGVPPTATATPTGTLQPTAIPTATQAVGAPTATVKTGRLNVRSGPGPGYKALATVVQFDVLTLLGRNANASWVKVKTAANVEGWVSSLYIIVSQGVSLYDLPVLAEVVPSGIIVTGTANVRAGPGINFTSQFTLNYGAIVNLVARNSSVSWIKITYNGQTGWVGSDLIASDYNFSFLPVATQ
jgi:uncharacterized protein YraI